MVGAIGRQSVTWVVRPPLCGSPCQRLDRALPCGRLAPLPWQGSITLWTNAPLLPKDKFFRTTFRRAAGKDDNPDCVWQVWLGIWKPVCSTHGWRCGKCPKGCRLPPPPTPFPIHMLVIRHVCGEGQACPQRCGPPKGTTALIFSFCGGPLSTRAHT